MTLQFLPIIVPKYNYKKLESKDDLKVSNLISINEIVAVSPRDGYDHPMTNIIVKSYPSTTSHWQGALAVSTVAITTYESFDEVIKRLGL